MSNKSIRKLRLFIQWDNDKTIPVCRILGENEILDCEQFARDFVASIDLSLDENAIENGVYVPLCTGDFTVYIGDSGLHTGVFWESQSFYTNESTDWIDNDSPNWRNHSI